MQNRPTLVGVTGGIGAGKSVVCRLFSILGIPVYNADDRAKMLMQRDKIVVNAIKNYLGPNAYLDDGNLNRTFLANTVFKDSELLEILNGIVHPAVARDFDKWTTTQKNKPYLVKEAALLIESGSAKVLDHIINVTAPDDIRIARVMARDTHRSEQQIKEIMENQLNDEERNTQTDFIINNDDNSMLIPQVLKIHELLISAAHIG